jgi:tetratricopeptide (TPR) repeat protein
MKPSRNSVLSALIIAVLFCSCGGPKLTVNPEARKLNDSAVFLAMNAIQNRDNALAKAIGLLDKAIQIDSDYYVAYQNRFSFQTDLKQYSAALESAKHMLKKYPNDVTILMVTGEAYERAGDKFSAILCYNKALSGYYKILDTMSVKNKNYPGFAMGKATILKLLDKKEQSDTYLKELLQNDTDAANNLFYEDILKNNKHNLLYGEGVKEIDN